LLDQQPRWVAIQGFYLFFISILLVMAYLDARQSPVIYDT
jgi:hypothetical protein